MGESSPLPDERIVSWQGRSAIIRMRGGWASTLRSSVAVAIGAAKSASSNLRSCQASDADWHQLAVGPAGLRGPFDAHVGLDALIT